MLLPACSSPQAPSRTPPLIVAKPLADAGAAAPTPAPESLPALDAALIESVPEGTYGPYLAARNDGRALVVWGAQEPGSGRRWFSTGLDAKGAALTAPLALSEAPQKVGLVAVRPAASGFVLLTTSVAVAGTGIEGLLLGAAGELTGNPFSIAHTHEEVLWLDALPVGASTAALFATRAAGSASLYLAPIAARGEPQREAAAVLEGVLAWQAVAYGESIALATILGHEGNKPRSLRVQFLDAEARRLTQAVIRTSPRLHTDLDAAVIGNNLVVVWSELDGFDSRLFAAALGADGQLVAPAHPLLEPSVNQELVKLVPPFEANADGFLVWELPGQAANGLRELELARLSAKASLVGPRARLRALRDGTANVEFAATSQGVAALARAEACQKPPASCSDGAVGPTFVEWSGKLEVIATEPLRLSALAGASADLGWALHCARDACSALAAASAVPVPIYGVDLRARSNTWQPIASAGLPEEKPYAASSRSVYQDEPLAAIASVPLGARSLVAWLTEFDPSTPYVRPSAPAPDGRLAPVRALLRVSSVGSEAVTALEASTVSFRAHSPGGLALAAAADGERALLVWTALDKGRPQVFVTLVDRSGKRVSQRMLTSSPGQVVQVTAAALPRGGFVVGWINAHEGKRRVFLARLAANLAQAAPHQELPSAANVPLEIRLAAQGDRVWLARSEQAEDAVESLTLTPLDPSDATPRGSALRIHQLDAGGVAAPHLEPTASGVVLLWVEHGQAGEERGQLKLQELDPNGRPRGEPSSLAFAGGEPEAAQLSCRAERCFGVVTVRELGSERLDAFEWRRGEPLEARTLLRRETGPGAGSQPLALRGHDLWYGVRRQGRGFLRRALLAW